MKEFTVDILAREQDGGVTPFRIYVGAPEPTDDQGAICLTWCSLIDKPVKVKGASERQAYRLGFDLVRRLVEYSDLVLETPDGSRFPLPSPSHEFEE